ncbi:MAG: hypothetical protein KIS84_12445, partial [Dokdonella sp.]|nr:hypothetical protein [Dokdonella sp.]
MALDPVLYAAPERQQDFIETLRRLWRHRYLIGGCGLVLGGSVAAMALSLPSYYVAESRVQVGVLSPRYFNMEAIVTEASPDQERVQNEGFVIQSRDVVREVIDRLKLTDNPEFNAELRPPSRWSRLLAEFGLRRWLTVLDRKGTEKPAIDPAVLREARMVDAILDRVDVSTLGRSHVLSVKAESQNPETAAAIANALADVYLEYQRKDKIKVAEQVEKFLQGRIAELREQVRKSDEAVEGYRKRYGLYKGQISGVTSQQLTELNTQLIHAQTAKAEAESRLSEAQALRQGQLGGESVPEVLRS